MKFPKFISKYFHKIPAPTPLKQVYKDKAGNIYYTFKNPAEIIGERALMAWVFTEDANLKMTKEKRVQCCNSIIQANDEGRKSDVGTIVNLMLSCEEMYCEGETLEKLALTYTFMNNEPKDGYTDYWQEAKRRAWDEDKDAKAFFLQFAYTFTKAYSEQPSLNVQKYLTESLEKKGVREMIDLISYHFKKGLLRTH